MSPRLVESDALFPPEEPAGWSSDECYSLNAAKLSSQTDTAHPVGEQIRKAPGLQLVLPGTVSPVQLATLTHLSWV
jgi:hypothetical protein